MKKNHIFLFLVLILMSFSAIFVSCGKEQNYKVELSEHNLDISINDNVKIDAIVEGFDASLLTWTTSNQNVAKYENGYIIAVGAGNAEISASYEGVTDKCAVKVTLGSNIPYLDVSYKDDELCLTNGQSFEINSKILFNGEEYTDFTIDVVSNENYLACTVDNQKLTVTAKEITNQDVTLTIKASWKSFTAENYLTLSKTISVKVIDDIRFSINNKAVSDVVLYTIDEIDGQQLQTTLDTNVEVYFNGEKLIEPSINITFDKPNVISYVGNTITAKDVGETCCEISVDHNGKTYKEYFNINVIVPTIAKTDNLERIYSIETNQFDLIGTGFTLSDVYAVEINNVKFDVEDSQLPQMSISTTNNNFKFSSTYTLDLRVDGIKNPIKLDYSVDKDELESVKFVLYSKTGYVYTFTNVKVYTKEVKTPVELESLFNTQADLDGIYVLGNKIDAKDIELTGALRKDYTFKGIFDGRGYTISNLDVSGTSDNQNGSLFGKIRYPAVIKNVAFYDVTADYAAIISSQQMGSDIDWTDTSNPIALRPQLKNIYVKVADGSTNFRGMISNKNSQHASLPNIENVIVEALNCVVDSSAEQDMAGSFFGHSWFWNNDNDGIKNNYVISNLHLHHYWGLSTYATFSGITRYTSVFDMQSATNVYSSFSSKYWEILNGVPIWKSTNVTIPPIIENLPMTEDNTERVFDLNGKSLDLSNLGIAKTDIIIIEINKVKLAVENGILPDLSLVNIGGNKVGLLGTNLSYELTFDEDIAPISVIIYTSNKAISLNNVKVYSQVIDTPTELETLFKTQSDLDGVYVLGANIDATDLQLTGAIRKDYTFEGIFDGRGYTISNLDVSGTSDNQNGSLFGKIKYPAVIENVAFYNVTANCAAIISSQHIGDYDWTDAQNPIALRAQLMNIYVKVADGSTNFGGIIAAKDSQHSCLPDIENVIVEALNCVVDSSAAQDMAGSFFGHTWFWNNDNDGIKNNYVISNLHLHNYWGLSNYDTFTGITRYQTAEAMKTANNDYSTFNYCWTVVSGDIPVWANLPN